MIVENVIGEKMIKLNLVLLILTFTLQLFGQEYMEYSVHKAHKQKFGIKENYLKKDDLNGIEIIPLQINKQKKLSKIIFGYMPDWEYKKGAHANQHYDLLTHIATFDFPVSSKGAIGYPSGWPWTDVINAAHTAGTKVIMTATNFEAEEIRNIITDKSAKQKFFTTTKSIITKYKLDGVNVDFEGLYSADKGSKIVTFMSELTSYIHTELPGKEVSFAGPAVNWGSRWDLDGLVNSCDNVLIMGYAFWGKWSSTAGPNAPLTGFTHNITNVVTGDYKIPLSKYSEKIILGVPYYGHEWKVLSENAYSKVDTTNGGYQGSTWFYNDIEKADIYGTLWDDKSQTSWFHWQEGEQWHQTWFDDVRSLEAKYNLAIAKKLGGIGMWALGYDGDKQDLWNLINQKFGSGTAPIPNKPTAFRVVQHNSNTLVLRFEVANYAKKYGVYLSYDGTFFSKITESISNSIPITNLKTDSVYYFKIEAINSSGVSPQTEVLAGIPSERKNDFLIVNGFDRVGSTTNTFDFIKMYDYPMKSLKHSFATASNEAVYKGYVNLSNYKIVIWMLLDESSMDDTFNPTEQRKIKDFIDTGGALVVSGSEVGWDLVHEGSNADKEFYKNYLKAKYVADAPENKKGISYVALDSDLFEYKFDDGTHGTINVDWPDAIEAVGGAVNTHTYKGVETSKGYAGVKYVNSNTSGGVVYLAFPIEAVYDNWERTILLKEILSNFETKLSVDDKELYPKQFVLYQNYPNPFNPTTTIEYSIPEDAINRFANIKIVVYDILGREVVTLVDEHKIAGTYKINFNATNLSSGTYLYRMTIGEFSESKKMILLR